MADWEDMAVVGRIARPHGLRGHVLINPETDFVENRFRVGASFWARTQAGDQQLRVASVRIQQGRPVVSFEGLETIHAVQRLTGLELRVSAETLQPLTAGTFYRHELAGCVVETIGGAVVGAVARVEGGAGGSRLVIEGRRGEVLIPLALDICVEIDVQAKRIRIDPPEGLLELNEK